MSIRIASIEFAYIDSAALFAQVVDQPWAIYLDSGSINAQRSENAQESPHANFDVLAINPDKTLVFEGQQVQLQAGDLKQDIFGDPLAVLKNHIPSVDNAKHFPYVPGALGYVSYDLARQFESIPCVAQDPEQLPQMAMGIYSVIVVVDHDAKKTNVLYLDVPQLEGKTNKEQSANKKQSTPAKLVEQWCELISNTLEKQPPNDTAETQAIGLLASDLHESLPFEKYQQRFQKIRDYTIAGDCYQVNLTKQFSCTVRGKAWHTYTTLRDISPAPYGAYMNFPFAQVLSNSPESFIQCRQGQVSTSPIKGTAPRDHNNIEKDLANAKALFESAKDRAENVMIVDLMRNDLSRCCEFGSVKVPTLFEVHSFANVHHLISTVTGALKSSYHSLDLLRNCFPGGSITGAPKVRAMEIIEELEPTRRGLYCGSIAYIGGDGNMETNIAIRTIVIKDGVARYSAGGGLVIDSKLESEYQELLDKSTMMTQSLFENKKKP